MYRVMLLTVGIVAVVAHPKYEPMHKCARIGHGGMACCKKELPTMPPNDDVKECSNMLKKPPPSCEFDMCLAKKRGLASDDGTIDKKKMEEYTEMLFENDQELVDGIKENCINGDLSKYGPPDMCDVKKQKMCMDMQFTISCNEWNEEGDCNGMKELAEECAKQFI